LKAAPKPPGALAGDEDVAGVGEGRDQALEVEGDVAVADELLRAPNTPVDAAVRSLSPACTSPVQ
jgi:hypothetical protein